MWLKPNTLVRCAVICALLSVVAFGTLSCAPEGPQAQQQWNQVRARVKYQLAQQQYHAGHFAEAIKTASDSLALDSRQAQAYALLSRAYLEMDKPASANGIIESAKRASLPSPELSYLEGVILEQRGETEEALAAYSEAQTLDPHNVDYLVAQVECLVVLGRVDEALQQVDDHHHLVDDNESLAALAGHIATLIGDPAGAAIRYREALSGAGKSAVVAESLGLWLAENGRCAEALSLLEPLLTEGEEAVMRAAVRRAAASCHLALDDAPSAVALLRDYARYHTNDTDAQVLFAKAAIAIRDFPGAVDALNRVKDRRAQGEEVKLLRAVVHWRQRDLSAAAGELDELLADHCENVDARCLLAEVLREQEKHEESRRHFERALRIDPKCRWAAQGLQVLERGDSHKQTKSPTGSSQITTNEPLTLE